MSRFGFVLLPLGVLCLATSVGPSGAPPEKDVKEHQVEREGQRFTLPDGFVIELVAGPPLVDRPITADFDEEGRLYVADSSGSNDKVETQLEKKPHRIVRLEDTDGDGKFDRSVVFADKMMFPEGTMWLDGSLYVAAPPSIWKLTDPDGDGVADQRAEWFPGKTLTHCANDLHGPYRGPDGWIYWCKGAFAQQAYERPGKPLFVTRAAHVFRCRTDGTDIEPVMTGGMDNPIDVVFSPGGERFFTTTFLQNPGGGKRDGIIHAVYGGVYGKDHSPVYEHPWTGPTLLPPLVHLGPAAPCGLTRYESSAFGAGYQDNLFACLFNMRKVTRHVLAPAGATFTTRDEDFLVSSSLDFHPTDVLEDADGSLLVVDTGGWYKLCCPTSQLVKPDVLGGIYRVRRKDAPKVEDPRGLKLAWGKMSCVELAKLLDDLRPAVRRRATEKLATRGGDAVRALASIVRENKSSDARRNAVWALTRIDRADAREAVREALADRDESVRQAATHSVSLWRDKDALAALLKQLKSESPHNQRAAAEALGRIGDPTAVPELLAAAGKTSDRVLEHSLTFALIEIADRKQTLAGLDSSNLRARRAALVALDQMEGGKLDAAIVARELTSRDAALKEAATWLVGLHPEWGPQLADVFRARLKATLTPTEREELARHLARLAQAEAIQDLLAEQLKEPTKTPEGCRIALRALALASLKQVPPTWVAGLTGVLNGDRAELLPDALDAARALPAPKEPPEKLIAALLRIGSNEKLPAEHRLKALSAVPGGLAEVSPALLTLLLSHLDPEQSVAARGLAADVVARARLSPKQLLTLSDALAKVGPLEINRVLEAFGPATDEEVGRCLTAALKTSPALSAVRVDALQKRLAKAGPAVQKELTDLAKLANADHEKQQARLKELLKELDGGDARRGQVVFNGPKAACASCHAIGYIGGTVGPDLTRVGQIRAERDLLESVVFPSTSFAQGYEPVLVTTKKGKVYNGVLRKNTPEEVRIVLNANEEVRLAREDIDEMQPGKVSVMPAGLEKQLTRQELADLIAFLKACR